MVRSRAAARAARPFEDVDGIRVELGGKYGYKHVRGKQGRTRDKFQGVSPSKKHRTVLFDAPRPAAVAFARMKAQLVLGQPWRGMKVRHTTAAVALPDFSAAVGGLMSASKRPLVPVACAPLRPEQAAAAVARGVAVAMAEEMSAYAF